MWFPWPVFKVQSCSTSVKSEDAGSLLDGADCLHVQIDIGVVIIARDGGSSRTPDVFQWCSRRSVPSVHIIHFLTTCTVIRFNVGFTFFRTTFSNRKIIHVSLLLIQGSAKRHIDLFTGAGDAFRLLRPHVISKAPLSSVCPTAYNHHRRYQQPSRSCTTYTPSQ